MEGTNSVLQMLVICVFCTSGVSLADPALANGDGFMLDLLLAHFNAFEMRVQQQLDLLQNNIERNRQDIESLSERLENVKESATDTDEEIFTRFQQVEHVTESLARTISHKLQVVKDSILSLAPAGQQTVAKALLSNESRFEMVDSSGEEDEFYVSHFDLYETVYRGTWLVFQRRLSGAVDFNRGWVEYRDGFGDIHDEHWLGLDRLHWLVSRGRHELLIILKDFDEEVVIAHYDDFAIEGEESQYRIASLGRYSGNAGDSLRPHNGKPFATFDSKTDGSYCAETLMGGWWFDKCYMSYLNGVYLQGHQRQKVVGIEWFTFRGFYYSMKKVSMMIRPVN